MAGSKDVKTPRIQIIVQYKFIEAYRSAKIEEKYKYAFAIYLGEAIESFSGTTYLPFTVDVETKPEGIFFKIKGEIFIKGPNRLVNNLVLSKNDEPPKIWSHLYEESMKMLTSLANHIEVIPPLGEALAV